MGKVVVDLLIIPFIHWDEWNVTLCVLTILVSADNIAKMYKYAELKHI